MAATATLDGSKVHFLRKATQRPASLSAKLRDLTLYAQQTRLQVERSWEEIPPEVRQALAELARDLATPPNSLSAKLQAVVEGVKLGIGIARGQITREELGEFIHAVNRLMRAVNNRLEAEDPAFQEALRKALAEESLPLTRDELRALVLDD